LTQLANKVPFQIQDDDDITNVKKLDDD